MKPISNLLLMPSQMAAADAAAAASGIVSFDLMKRAGYAVAAAALARYPGATRHAVFCGPGNNGGDGYVAAMALAQSGADVACFSLGDIGALRGDARLAFDLWARVPQDFNSYEPAPGDLVIDAIFGAGLSRNVPPEVQELVVRIEAARLPVLAVDLPSGLCGRRGIPLGAAFAADCTVTFMARKPGHLLLPGRELCGDLQVVDIGIPSRIITSVLGELSENAPSLWRSSLPVIGSDSHKYRRGHLAVFSGGASKTGACRLSALAGLKSGAGLVTVASPASAMTDNAAHLTAVMMTKIDTAGDLQGWLEDPRLSAFVLGPGFGIGNRARDFALELHNHPLVLDADGISSFKDDPAQLFAAFGKGVPHLVLTPHEGEFRRLFPDIAANQDLGKVEKAILAAACANGIIVYKGADTVIASPDGRATINTNGPPWLATAGSGDVLAGMIGALLAQGMPAFEAAAAGAYLHGEAAHIAGPGMTAEDLAEASGRALARIAVAN